MNGASVKEGMSTATAVPLWTIGLYKRQPMMALIALVTISIPTFLLTRSQFVEDLTYLVTMTFAVAIMVWGILTFKPLRPMVWWLLSLALGFTLPGQLLNFAARWSTQPITAEPWADLFFLGGYLLAVAACLLMIRQHGGKRDWVGVIDAGILVLGVAILAWVFILHPLIRSPEMESSTLWLWAGINVVLDLLLTFLLARLAMAPSKMSMTRKLVIACITVLLTTDFVFLSIGVPERPPPLLRVGWIITYLLAAGAAAHPSMRHFGHTVRPEKSPDRIRKVILGLSLIAPTAVGVQALAESNDELAFIMFLLAGLLGLLGIRIERMMRLVEDSRSEAEEAARQAGALADNLAGREEKFRSLIQNATDGVLIVSSDATISYASPAIEKIYGIPVDQMVGFQGLSLIDDADRSSAMHLLQEALDNPGKEIETQLRIRHADGGLRCLEFIGRNLLHVPAIQGIVLNCRDITERMTLEEELKRQAFFDSLTGLANRALLRDRAGHALRTAQRTRGMTALIMFDVDDFKHVNDELGHEGGDELLREVAERARAMLRESDTLGRLGGDEFAILLENLESPQEAEHVAERLIDTLRNRFVVRGKQLSVQVSAGIVVVERGAASVEEVFHDSDVAMYEAKRSGKNGFRLFDPAMHSRTLQRLEMRSQLDTALRDGEFEIFYQPQIDLMSRQIVGVEALLRWHHPDRGLISPADFIPIAEESGAIVPIGNWVLRESMRQVAEWNRRSGARLSVSVNVSASQFSGGRLTAEVTDALASSGLAGRDVVLEITESVLLDRDDEVLAALDRLRAAGLRLAIDDFGTGYSSLGYLKDLPISILKIDRAFVANVTGGREASAFAQAIVHLGQALGLDTLAEGIETEEQAATLEALGCDFAQGFLFSRPLPASKIEQLIHRGGNFLPNLRIAASE